jgi:hypothetical protein
METSGSDLIDTLIPPALIRWTTDTEPLQTWNTDPRDAMPTDMISSNYELMRHVCFVFSKKFNEC